MYKFPPQKDVPKGEPTYCPHQDGRLSTTRPPRTKDEEEHVLALPLSNRSKFTGLTLHNINFSTKQITSVRYLVNNKFPGGKAYC